MSGAEGLLPWGKYEIIKCIEPSIPGFCGKYYYSYHITSRLYSTADKCTNIGSSNQCLAGNQGLWAGSCTGGAGDFYKCCCNNQTNNPVSSVGYYGETNDNYPPPEGVCPAGSSMKWKSGAVIDPSECQNICNPVPQENFCYHPDPDTCRYGTLEELDIDVHLASTWLQLGTLRNNLTREQCSYLCNDLYVCKDCSPVSVKGKYTGYNECVDAEKLYCFERRDPVYETCSSSCTPGEETTNPGRFYYCSPLANNCVHSQQAFPSLEACEDTVNSTCYLNSNCDSQCSSLTTFSWCNPDGNCSSGNYVSEESCENAVNGTCYSEREECTAVCRGSGGTGCDLPADSGNDISVSLEANRQCLPNTSTGNQSRLNWNIDIDDDCAQGSPTNNRFSCTSCNMPAPTTSTGSTTVSPSRTTEYGISCTRDSYRCCWEETVEEECDCVGEGENRICQTCTRTVEECDNGHGTSRQSDSVVIRVVGKPEVSFTAVPPEILYSSEEIGIRKYSNLRWNSTLPNPSFASVACTLSGDGRTYDNLNPFSSLDVAPTRTTTYSLRCRNEDNIDSSCYVDSDQKQTLVRVFGAGIEEQRPPQIPMIDLENLMGKIIKALGL
ncbi:MAG TPA: hypothetical protein PKG74_01160 [Candidatus Colwellbacteria bacterium]|nr:hypothetical protein [Candidatus Colwellbacteria bacterium]